jgi:hypothetical protein
MLIPQDLILQETILNLNHLKVFYIAYMESNRALYHPERKRILM